MAQIKSSYTEERIKASFGVPVLASDSVEDSFKEIQKIYLRNSIDRMRPETILPKIMIMKIIIDKVTNYDPSNNSCEVVFALYDGSGGGTVYDIPFSYSGITTSEGFNSALAATIISTAGGGLTAADIIGFPSNNPFVSARSFANPSRSLNSAFQISTARDTLVSYTVDIAATLSLTTGQTGTVTLQYADDSGFTTNVKTIQSSVNGNAGTLAIGLGLTQTTTASLSGVVPAGKYVKLITANTVGTPTFTFRAAQEVLL